MSKIHIPGNDFIPPETSNIAKIDIMSAANDVAYTLKIKGNKKVEAGIHYIIRQINDTEAVIELADNLISKGV